jgi:glycosyltransferase involved in cell wall biosynthesis
MQAVKLETGAARRLRVLFFMTRDARDPRTTGGDIGMWERALYLAEQGHSVTALVSSYEGAAKEEMVDRVRIVRLGGVRTLWLTTCLYYLRQCRGRYDVVVTEGFGGSRIPRLAPLYVKEPVITEWHQIHADLFAAQYPMFLLPVLNAFERAVAYVHRNTTLMVRTPEWKTAFPRLGFKPDRIFVVPACIWEDWIEEGQPGQASDPIIVWLGKFRRYKCPDHAILAMLEVVREVPKARLILAGRHDDLKYEARLQAMVRDLGLATTVEFRFNIAEREKRELLRRARSLVLPSAVEGFGIVVLEANALGVPVIASDGVPESVVQDGGNGLRYAFGDIHALARAMTRVLSQQSHYLDLSRNSVRFAAGFEWREVCARYEKVLEHAASAALIHA